MTTAMLMLLVFQDPKPESTGESLAGPVREIVDLKALEVKLDAGRLREDLAWAGDGKAFYCYEWTASPGDRPNGVLRRIAYPERKEEARLVIGRPCSNLSLGGDGVLVGLPDLQEVWVLHGKTLEVQKKINVPDLGRVASSKGVLTAYASQKSSDSLCVLDLKRGIIAREYRATNFLEDVSKNKVVRKSTASSALTQWDHLTVSPNGKSVYVFNGNTLHRFGSTGGVLQYEEIGAGIGQVSLCAGSIVMSSDGLAVAMAGFWDDAKDQNNPRKPALFVYRGSDLSKPDKSLKFASLKAQVLAFGRSGTFLGSDPADQLVVFDSSGKIRSAHRLEGGAIRAIHPHSDPSRILLLTEKNLYIAEFPKKP